VRDKRVRTEEKQPDNVQLLENLLTQIGIATVRKLERLSPNHPLQEYLLQIGKVVLQLEQRHKVRV
tara:strand:+ start:249 stop:446 length:198 start_codon:yes stop_codon:yes gene_type:complete